MPRRLDRELSFRQAAAALGRTDDPDGRRLRSMVLARERQMGRQIAIRLAGPKRPRLRVTLAELSRRFPELRETQAGALGRELRELVDRQLDDRIRAVVRSVVRHELELARAEAACLAGASLRRRAGSGRRPP